MDRSIDVAERTLRGALADLANRLEQRLTGLRARGRTRRTDPIRGLAIEPGDAEGILAEIAGENAAAERGDRFVALSAGIASFDRASEAFGLSPFERDVLLVALAPEIDARFGRLFGYLNDSVVALRPTIGLVTSLLVPDDARRALSAFLPGARLDRFGLIVLEGDGPLAGQAIRIPPEMWPRLAELRSPPPLVIAPAVALDELVLEPRVRASATAAAEWMRARDREPIVIVQGPPGSGRTRLAQAIASAAHWNLVETTDAATRATIARESLWYRAAVFAADPTPDRLAAVLDAPAPIVLVAEHAAELALQATLRPICVVHVEPPGRALRAELWRRSATHLPVDDALSLVDRYRFGPARVEEVIRRAGDTAAGPPTVAEIHRAAGESSVVRMRELATREATPHGLDALIVPPTTRREVEVALAWARQRQRTFASDGAGGHLRAGVGLACLFWGPPGTGKTMAAGIVAREAGLELYRVDLAHVVNKYIGETEKRLASLLDEAERANVVVFFDEADTLFAKRTEIRDAHDRHANIETGYLLQRLEHTTAIVVLASNLRQNLDPAFLRRMHVVTEFPPPTVEEKRVLWQRMLPAEVIADAAIDLRILATSPLTGGEIRTAVATALVVAADAGVAVSMADLVWGVCRELTKVGRIITASDFGPWQHVAIAHARGTAIER